jgi:hypothetical protein
MQLQLQGAAPNAPAALVFGAGEAPQSLFGGTLVPAPEIVLFGATDAAGAAGLSFVWPAGVAARWTFTSQYLVLDAGAGGNVAFSNALRGIAPP